VWELVTGFSGYAFCKAHSTAYGVEAYQAAWLKRYYPAEFMAGVLTNGKGFYDPLVYVLECHRLGLKLLSPSINRPGPAFAVENGAIRVPAVRAKGLRESTIDRLLAERERGAFASLADFHRRVCPTPRRWKSSSASAPSTSSAVPHGAILGEPPRAPRLWPGRVRPGLAAAAEDLNRLPQTSLHEPTRREQLEAETELMGFAVSGHPLELFNDVTWDTYCPVSRLGDYAGREVVTCGLIVEQRTHHQVTGEPMKFLTLADWTGMVETELFAAPTRATVWPRCATRCWKCGPGGAIRERAGFSLRVSRAANRGRKAFDEPIFCSRRCKTAE